MIWRPRWRNVTTHTDDSPFNSRPAVRPLRLTFHITEEPATEDAEALTVVQNILRPELFKWLDTAEGSAQRLSIGTQIVGEDEQGVALVTNREGAKVGGAAFWPERWREVAASVAATSDDSRGRLQSDVMVVAGHEAWQHDLLVTTATALLANRNIASFIDANICSPREAAKIVGLFLRFREHWGFTSTWTFDANFFYSVMLRAKFEGLRSDNRLGAVQIASDSPIAQTRYTSTVRCRRALEALDAIGVQFHRHASWRTAELMLYHFDYLTLLLTGAFDAAARVARTVLDLPAKPKQIHFWKPEFLHQLKASAPLLHNVATSNEMVALKALLYRLRNKIHDARLGEMMYSAPPAPTIIVTKLHEGDWPHIYDAAETLGGAKYWGLVGVPQGGFEPYTYASRLLDKSFGVLARIDQAIAASAPQKGAGSGGAPAQQATQLRPELLRAAAVLC
jgi:hypothetical protein